MIWRFRDRLRCKNSAL